MASAGMGRPVETRAARSRSTVVFPRPGVVGLLVGLCARIARIRLHRAHPEGLRIRATSCHCCDSPFRQAWREAH